MKTKVIKFCLTFLIVFYVTPVFARENIIDNAGLLSQQEKASLLAAAASAASAYNFDLVIVTVKNIGASSPADYADNFFDRNGYGLGQNRDGCLFLLVTDSRDYWFSTSGRGIKILNSAASDKLENSVVKLLGEDNYYGAFNAFLTDWQTFLTLAAKGRNYNFFQQWNLVLVLIAWVLALAIGFIVVHIWKRAMDTVLPQTQAAAYVVPGSLAFREKKDSFLYSTVSKTKIQTQTQSQGSSSARNISVGSSGRSHGGRGGKY
ncbi:MAG: TPM domain-containing protein [Treponema sp.]|jgi:uncharacterized protein|nr:TPM domain-containing protein [Treponema sp.]